MTRSLLRADLHVHTTASPDGSSSPAEIVSYCEKVGLSCVAITDHNTIQGALEAQKLAKMRVIVGEEVLTSIGEIIGLFLREEVPRDMPASEVIRAIKAQGGLVCIPHPFDRFRSGILRSSDGDLLAASIDIVEVYNARTMIPGDNHQAQKYAERHGLPACVGSDSHSIDELGHTYVEMPVFDGSPGSFLMSLQNARLVKQRGNPIYKLYSTYAKWRRFLGFA
jgi:predicted metal-dependent phosphoesterase TrpH